ncbi:unnamed protein product [Arctogadus glacialis]
MRDDQWRPLDRATECATKCILDTTRTPRAADQSETHDGTVREVHAELSRIPVGPEATKSVSRRLPQQERPGKGLEAYEERSEARRSRRR